MEQLKWATKRAWWSHCNSFRPAQKHLIIQHIWRRLLLCSSITCCIPWWNSMYVALHDKWLCLLFSKCLVTFMYGFVLVCSMWQQNCPGKWVCALVWTNTLFLLQVLELYGGCLSFLLSFFLSPSLFQAFCKANHFSAHIDLDCFSISLVDAFSYPFNSVWVQDFIHLQNSKGKIKLANMTWLCVMPLCALLQSYHINNDQIHRQAPQLIRNRDIRVCYTIEKHKDAKSGMHLGKREFCGSRHN